MGMDSVSPLRGSPRAVDLPSAFVSRNVLLKIAAGISETTNGDANAVAVEYLSRRLSSLEAGNPSIGSAIDLRG